MNYASATIAGHIGHSAEAKPVGDRTVISFTMATSRKAKDTEQTTWWRINYWVKTDKVSQYLTKGTAVLVSGEPFQREYEKKDGTKGYSLEIDAKDVKLIGGKKDRTGEPENAAPAPVPRRPADIGGGAGDSEPPFLPRCEWE